MMLILQCEVEVSFVVRLCWTVEFVGVEFICGGVHEMLISSPVHWQWKQQQLFLSMLARKFQGTRTIK